MKVKISLVMTKSKLNEYKADEEMKYAKNDKREKVKEEHFLNVSSDTSLVSILKDLTEIEIQSMVDVLIHQKDSVVLRTPLVDTIISMVTEKTTPTPKQTPPTIKAQVTSVSKSDQSSKFEQRSFQEHKKHLDLYNAMIGSIGLDEAIKKDSKPSKYDQAGLSKKGNTPSKSLKTDKYVNADETVEETVTEVAMDVEELVNGEIEPPQDDASPKQDKSTWFEQPPIPETPDLECIDLEYDLEQCYLSLSYQLDWTNPERDICPIDMSKPLPLRGPPGHLTSYVDFFFNNDLEYLKTRNKERKYTVSLTKTKAARYDLKGIENMISKLWSIVKEAYDKNDALGIYHWGPKRKLFYISIIEILVRRDDLKEYTFKEVDFSRLHLNDIEDMFLLHVQRKIHNLTGDEIVHLDTIMYAKEKMDRERSGTD
uniref:Uncharacterized protein n=1 Tax=Tanacetum cinerariifolium TaxID=118510 RepID=A0A6L2JGN2_TANCI|nr:hypothetical protein [Tanacetum cinerariifolium]